MMKLSCNNFLILLLILLSLTPSSLSNPHLSHDYYAKTCPKFLEIVERVITDKQLSFPSTAAGTLRLFFHDCMVEGCDASLLIASTAFNKAERDSELDASLPGDAYDVIIRAKTVLELECPGVVSCADILAVATRDLVKMVGGPFYNVLLGRKDGLTSIASSVEGHLATPNMTVTKIISLFEAKGLNVQEMVTLLGAHTIGFAHCEQFIDRIFHFNATVEVDPSLNAKYAESLRKLCANYKTDPGMTAFNDVMTPGKFDNMYYQNLQRGLGLLASDQAIATDPRTKPYVDLYASDESKFFEEFAKVMEKVSVYKVKTGKEGEVRHRCDAVNKLSNV